MINATVAPADELIPFEVEAELSGALPDDVTAAHKKRAIELGVFATNLPPRARRRLHRAHASAIMRNSAR